MNQSTKLFAAVMAFAIYGFTNSCSSDNKPDFNDLAVRVALLEINQSGQIDSLKNQIEDLNQWVYDVEKEQRIAEQWAQKDYEALKQICDSMAQKNPKEGRVWKRIGWVLGEAGKRIIPGL